MFKCFLIEYFSCDFLVCLIKVLSHKFSSLEFNFLGFVLLLLVFKYSWFCLSSFPPRV